MTQVEPEETQPHLLVKGWVPPSLDRDFTVVGKPVNRIDAPEKVTGRARYAGDMKLPNMLHAKILRSPYSHARIKRVDTGEAARLHGVRAILTKDNTRGWSTLWYWVPQPAFPEVVTFVGQEVAVVAADDIDTARSAVNKIEVEYEKLPAVFDVQDALKNDAPRVLVDDSDAKEGNIFGSNPSVLSRGDINEGFKAADFVVEGTYKTPFQYPGSLQTRTCVAQWDGSRLTVYESCQGVWEVREQLARSLGLEPRAIRVVTKYQGGGFGGKGGAQRFVHYAAKLSMMTKRPVRLEFDRAEEFFLHPRRSAALAHFKSGVRKDGTLTAMYARVVLNIGSGGNYGRVPYDAIMLPHTLYRCPNTYFEQLGVHTNLQYSGPVRSPTMMIAVSCLEAHVDEVAEAVGLDPIDFRLLNYNPYADQERRTRFSSKSLDKAMKSVADAIGWERRRQYAHSPQSGPRRRGLGMATYMYHGVGLPPYEANADVIIRRDGTCELHAGVTDIGTGSATALSMIAAEELGVEMDDVQIAYGDTDSARFASPSMGSRVIPEMGPAVLQAAAEARNRLFAVVAPTLQVPVGELRSAGGYIYPASNPSRRVAFKDACRELDQGSPVAGHGSRAPNPGSFPRKPNTDPMSFATFGAAAAEVEVDVETGEVRVLRTATAHEFGRVINPKLSASQHYGGVLMGLGFALLEEPLSDGRTGAMLNPDLHQYRMPTSLESPEMTPINIEGEDSYFAYSAKGAGEAIDTGVPAAIRNAVHNATGVWLREYPMTSDRVLSAIKKKEREELKTDKPSAEP